MVLPKIGWKLRALNSQIQFNFLNIFLKFCNVQILRKCCWSVSWDVILNKTALYIYPNTSPECWVVAGLEDNSPQREHVFCFLRLYQPQTVWIFILCVTQHSDELFIISLKSQRTCVNGIDIVAWLLLYKGLIHLSHTINIMQSVNSYLLIL